MQQLYFEKYANFPRENEPVNVSIPFKQGDVAPEKLQTLKIFAQGENGEEVPPLQARPLALWQDGTVKWCHVNFLANLPVNKDKTYSYNFTGGAHPAGIAIDTAQEVITVTNGCNTIVLNNTPGAVPFRSFSQGALTIGQDQIQGPYVVDSQSTQYQATLTTPWEVEVAGAVMAKLSAKGVHQQGDNTFMECIVTITVHAGAPWFELDYRIINKEAPEYVYIKKIALDITLPQEENTAYHLATSNYRTHIRTGEHGEPLALTIDPEYLLSDANEQFPESFYGTFFANWTGAQGGLCVTQYQAYQNCPKSLQVGQNMLSVDILPDMGDQGLKYYRGMAKSHKIFLHLHQGEAIENLNKRSLMLQHPDKPLLSPEYYEATGVYPNIFAQNKHIPFEAFLYNIADIRGKAYGILHWGDCPDMGYSQQGRGGGQYVWTNNEYDFPLAAMQLFARSGARRMLDYALVTAKHWADIDVCHHDPDPLKYGAQIEHSRDHVTGNIEISHEWVEGLFAYYHQTGCQFAYNTAIGIGENIMRHLDQPRYHQKGDINARETGWALRALIAIYLETNDASWLKYIDFILSHFTSWKETYGGWFSPYTCHTVVRVPFMISVAACSLMRYYRVFPKQAIKDMIIDAVDDLIENTMINGLFYYKENPSLRKPYGNSILLEALASAYELTGDKKYLRAGLPTFNLNLQRQVSSGGKKEIIDGGLLIPGTGPKGFAQSFFPMAYYYAKLSESGVYTEI